VSTIDDAIRLENQAEANYRKAAQETLDPGVREILTLLADEEAQHAESLAALEMVPFEGPDLLDSARKWIRGVVEGGASRLSTEASLLDVLRRAMTIEQTTEAFYRDHQNRSQDEPTKELFRQLAEAERNHYHFVSSLVEYYDRPNEWVESAEFGLRDEY